ncbi:MAG: site-specific DNA-methyltransferase [Actinobacteria bacterium]|nr:site-specific DNA-methyltransferase [Actinomycetota bacterium]
MATPTGSSEDAAAGVAGPKRRTRRPTRTSSFGVSRRESHDSSAFYARFDAPVLSNDAEVRPCSVADQLFCGDSRDMAKVPDKSVSLVTTSPPYHASKNYELDVNAGHVPNSYVAYLKMLHDVFAECQRVLEPGGRIAVNVANLGRRPYRSLSKDVWVVLEALGFLPQGEVVWVKGKGASGSAAFGSFARASRPVLRDLTERILIASKGRFERAIPWRKRQELGLPWESTISKEDFLAWTLDVWEMRPESARRVGHPAPFPLELPRRLIELYTYRGDVVLDPFMGSGSTAAAAAAADRRYVGFDTDSQYVALAERRVAKALAATKNGSR